MKGYTCIHRNLTAFLITMKRSIEYGIFLNKLIIMITFNK